MPHLKWTSTAKYHAKDLLSKLGINSIPICPFFIAEKLEIEIMKLPPNKKGVSGMLLQSNDNFGILYATYLNNEGYERFSICHEIGHYYLPGHPEKILKEVIHQSQAGFTIDDRFEFEADQFAANLLMPAHLFEKEVDKFPTSMNSIEKLSKIFVTSLTATAIRYIEFTPAAVAVILSTSNVIDYCFMSDTFKEFKGIEWIKKGTPLPTYSITHKFNKDKKNVLKSFRREGYINIQHWFGGDYEIELVEEVLGLGNYGKTLTILYTTDLSQIEDIEEEETLEELWTPQF